MSSAAKTMVAFGVYMALVGAILAAYPNALLGLLGLPPTEEVWLRILGLFMVIVAYYYYVGARSEATAFFRATVAGRAVMAIFLAFLGLSGAAGTVLVLFGGAELLGAVATGMALRSAAPANAGSPAVRRTVG
jgi:hypothetical protein